MSRFVSLPRSRSFLLTAAATDDLGARARKLETVNGLHFNLPLFQVMAKVSQSKLKRWLLHKALAAKEADLKRFLLTNRKSKLHSLLRPTIFEPLVASLTH